MELLRWSGSVFKTSASSQYYIIIEADKFNIWVLLNNDYGQRYILKYYTKGEAREYFDTGRWILIYE